MSESRLSKMEARHARIGSLALQNQTVAQIAKKVGLTQMAIYTVLWRLGIKAKSSNRTRLTAKQKSAIRKALLLGQSPYNIANTVGVNFATVYRIRKELETTCQITA